MSETIIIGVLAIFIIQKKGKGSPILLIHDMLPGGSGYEWTRIEDELALEHTVYNLDLPGCGRSEKPGHDLYKFCLCSGNLLTLLKM